MSEKLMLIKEVSLKNNCPECFNNTGLHLTFKQKIVETKFYKSITPEINRELSCKTCHTIIYPVQWTDDIDKVVEYQQKAFTPKQASTYLKKVSWILIGMSITAVIFLAITIYYLNF
ncbi:hypothetical protein VOI54_06105 [Tamlana sp. 2201CG12-4]|uniref:hypothetical protein n=1 Tax=Tamlana sp. 2201CG12-4 TaxID=3112582 RepID=UPI002DBA458C|nr:hypothetical protein [Tamlana sp. 2201CG12-4]MEC3906583.1 hypothetical protein [Tamlana sp. 2201CG12-4]